MNRISFENESPSPDSSGNPFAFSLKSKRLKRIAGNSSLSFGFAQDDNVNSKKNAITETIILT